MSKKFPLDYSQYDIMECIGRGSTSDVYRALCLSNNKEIAIKVIDLERHHLEIEYLRNECAFWSISDSTNIVDYYGSFIHGSVVCIVMEYCGGGSIQDITKSAFPNGLVDEELVATILKGLLLALNYIHSNEQVHRDIKPGNILLDHNGVIKLGDFGVSASLTKDGDKCSRYTVTGTPCYMAPEVVDDQIGYTEKADIWSFGVTAIELITGQNPYANLPMYTVLAQILKAPPPRLPFRGKFSPELKDLIKKTLTHDFQARPSAAQLLEHPFILKAKDESYLVEKILSTVPAPKDRIAQRDKEMAIALEAIMGNDKPARRNSWLFDDVEPEPPNVEKRGRFIIKKSSAQDAKSSEERVRELEAELNALKRKIIEKFGSMQAFEEFNVKKIE